VTDAPVARPADTRDEGGDEHGHSQGGGFDGTAVLLPGWVDGSSPLDGECENEAVMRAKGFVRRLILPFGAVVALLMAAGAGWKPD